MMVSGLTPLPPVKRFETFAVNFSDFVTPDLQGRGHQPVLGVEIRFGDDEATDLFDGGQPRIGAIHRFAQAGMEFFGIGFLITGY